MEVALAKKRPLRHLDKYVEQVEMFLGLKISTEYAKNMAAYYHSCDIPASICARQMKQAEVKV